MIRAFIAIEIDPQLVRQISAMITDLKPRIAGYSLGSPANFHLTLKFLGDIEESKIEPIAQALELALRPFPRFTINAKDLGVFPDLKRPRVLWIGPGRKEITRVSVKGRNGLELFGLCA